MPTSRVVESPYLPQVQAAAFIHRKERTFRDYVKRYKIPRYGPGRNLYLVDDLRAFMEDPDCFLGKKTLPRSRSFGFTPVRV